MLLVLSFMVSGPGFLRVVAAQQAPAAPPAPVGAPIPGRSTDATPPRVSYMAGEVSFWRPGAQDWTPAQLNTPLAPGDVLYAAQGASVEIQAGPGAFVRATDGTQIGLDNQEPDFTQFRVTAGHAALDLRQLAPGSIIELDTPNATFTIERPGYYHVDVDQDATALGTYHGGHATMTAVGGVTTSVVANQQVVVMGTDSPRLAMGAAPELTAWDRWNHERTDQLLRPASARYVSTAIYGTEALDQYGTWRTVATYGPVWVPAGVPVGWVPYSTGRWIWDPRFGWTWLDDAPWGWAPYHHGRWIFLGSYWAWAPGPIVVRPVYAPALVVFLGPTVVGVHHPVYWAPLGWGEPVIPWWGRPGFVGVPRWAGWGGPRVINNVVINRNTTVTVTNINVYRNVNVTNAIVGVPANHFGRGRVEVARVNPTEARQLKPVRGALAIQPVAASVMPSASPAIKPPAAIRARSVVATRPPKDWTPTLRAQGLVATPEGPRVDAPRLVPSPKVMKPSVREPGMAPGPRPNITPRGPAATPEPRRDDRWAPSVGSPSAAKTGPPPPRQTTGPGAPRELKKSNGARPGMPPPPREATAPGAPRELKKSNGARPGMPPLDAAKGGPSRETTRSGSPPERGKGDGPWLPPGSS
jgi:hypothetical protein